MKVRNRLLNFGENIIYQDDDYFTFSLDSVLLANFVNIKYTDKKILDLCSGNAPIPMLLTFRTKAQIYGIELQKEVYDLGISSILENKMDEQINFICDDVMNSDKLFSSEYFDVITCNPPYFKYSESSYVNDVKIKTIARHEVKIKLEDIILKSSYLLKNGGTLAIVHRPDRFVELLDILKKYNFEPKRIRFVHPKNGADANIMLVEATKNGKSGIKVISPLISHNSDGSYCDEIREMFGSDNNVAK